MRIDLLSKAQLSIINKNNFRYPLQVAEKDYFLAVILRIIYNSKLKDSLVFKSGTAIHHLYLEQLRFSEDLDFLAREKLSIDDITEIFKPYDFLEIAEYYPSDFSLKVQKLKFLGPLGQANSIKLDIDLTQKLILPTNKARYRNFYNLDVATEAMSLKEICAGKIRAINERARYRDFYDLAMVMKANPSKPNEIVKILKQKELREPLKREAIISNLKIAEDALVSGSENLYYRENLESNEIKETVSQFLSLL